MHPDARHRELLLPKAALARQHPSRLFTRRVLPANSSDASVPARVLWIKCCVLGLVFGLIETVAGLVYRAFEFRVSDPDLWVNWHTPWMAPIAQAVWFFGVGVLLSLARLALPRVTRSVAGYVLVALGAWSVVDVIAGLHPWATALLVLGASVRFGPRVRLDTPFEFSGARRLWAIALGIWLILFGTIGVWPLLVAWWGVSRSPSPVVGKPNVLLVVLDTVRADHLSVNGYFRNTTPHLREWAQKGVRFSNARATAPYTLGSHASMFTGRWMSETSARVNAPLDGRHTTLAQHLRDRGYETGGFVGNIFYCSARYGLDRGFGHYHDTPGNITRRVTPRELLRSTRLGACVITWLERKWHILRPMQRMRLDAGEVNREALAWIDEARANKRPFFAFLNYFDAHSPYSLPAEAPQPYSSTSPERLEKKLDALKALQTAHDRNVTVESSAALQSVEAEVHEDLRNSYDDGIAWIDAKIDELLHALEARGVLENTLVVITSDHGEMLGEQGMIGHGNTLHRPVTHVPLVILGTSGGTVPSGRTVESPVSLRDLPATILETLGDRQHGFPGKSLAASWSAAPAESASSTVASEMEHMPWMPHSPRMPSAFGPMWLITHDQYSYHRQEHQSLGTVERLFDLGVDPGETADLSARPQLRGVLERSRLLWRATFGNHKGRDLSPEISALD